MCEKCQFTTTTINVLNEHMTEKHRIYKCDKCNFNSSSDVGLKVHKTKSHPKIDPTQTEKEILIECDNCVLNVKDNNDLENHVRDNYEGEFMFFDYCGTDLFYHLRINHLTWESKTRN